MSAEKFRWLISPTLQFDVVNPAWAKQYERALGEHPFCVRYEPRYTPYVSPCTGYAEIRVVYNGREDVRSTIYCRACAGELVEQLQAAIAMHDAIDDPRRDVERRP